MKNIVKVVIGADLVPTKSNKNLFSSGDVKSLFGTEILNLLNLSDVRLFNLETPLVNFSSPIKKCGPILGIEVDVINGIKKLNPSCLTLANNHIMDHGNLGLKSTTDILKENDINFCGVGDDIENVSKFWQKEINGVKLCVYACAEHEFSIAAHGVAGANPFDVLKSYDDILKLSQMSDFVIVLYHGGKEFYPYPSPDLQSYCRKFIDCGADLVVCQHSHCIGCEEEYRNGKIIYGQGNFIFDDGTNLPEWNNGLLLNLEVGVSHKLHKLDYTFLSRNNNCVRISTKKEAKKLYSDYNERSQRIKDISFVQDNYTRFAMNQLFTLLRKYDLIGSTFLFKFLNKITHQKFGNFYFKNIYLKKKSFDLQNVIECEAWRELVLRGIKNYNDKRSMKK